ncbi:MAG TPA: sensor histidine kinase [Sphingobium sp.]|uniref:sensor histidine kinase n=1 Tax=Sphingobium sp. TaxID=1912891 RepID=UPI002ED6AA1D
MKGEYRSSHYGYNIGAYTVDVDRYPISICFHYSFGTGPVSGSLPAYNLGPPQIFLSCSTMMRPRSDPPSSERLPLIIRELRHRFGNLLSIVDALADRTARESASLSDFLPAYRGRLAALGRAQRLLFLDGEEPSLSFNQLIRLELFAHGAGSFEDDQHVILEGSATLRLPADTVQILALAIHELATNSAKYGALSGRGILTVSWGFLDIEGKLCIRIVWDERLDFGRNGETDTGTGFGRELIERALPLQLGAQTRYALTNESVHCIIELPWSPGEMNDG